MSLLTKKQVMTELSTDDYKVTITRFLAMRDIDIIPKHDDMNGRLQMWDESSINKARTYIKDLVLKKEAKKNVKLQQKFKGTVAQIAYEKKKDRDNRKAIKSNKFNMWLVSHAKVINQCGSV